MRTNPHILEVNTAVWLNSLSQKYGKRIPLCHVPDEEIEQIKSLGFDAVWLMGIWARSPKAQEIARSNGEVQRAVSFINPNYKTEDITASPYAVYDYNIDQTIGTMDGLLRFKQRLNERGIALLLDFVGNHFAIDYPKTLTEPDLFINTGTTAPQHNPELFFKTENGYYLAHGRDPFFPPWEDTVQLNHFNPKTQDFMIEILRHIAKYCDGVRCDMAMLSLNKVHKDTWHKFLGDSQPGEEFWLKAVSKIQEEYPDFTFIAEVYWGLEWDIQEMGFDYTYDKIMYDRLRFSTPENIKGHLGAEHLYQMRSIRFIANHDEEAALVAFGKEKSLAASTLIATIPGARMFFCQQLLGHKNRFPVQYAGTETHWDEDIFNFYRKLLEITNHPAFHGGQWNLTKVEMINDSETYKNVLAWTWSQGMEHKLVVINYSDAGAVCKLSLNRYKSLSMKDEFEGVVLGKPEELYKNGLTLELKPYESKIYSIVL